MIDTKKKYWNIIPNRKDLLILNVCEGESWEKLCPFLEVKDIKDINFPHEYSWKNRGRKRK